MTWTWRAASPGDKYAIVPVLDGAELPYSVCRVSGRFEAWHRHTNPRGGYWGGEIISIHDDPHQARTACMAHAQTPSPSGDGTP